MAAAAAAFLAPVEALLSPWLMLAHSAYYIPVTVVRLVRARQWSALVRWRQFQPAWFANFWAWAGARIRDNVGKNTLVPLLQGRIRHGKLLEERSERTERKRLPAVSGVVVEVGPGNGMWVSAFAEFVKPKSKSSSSSKKKGVTKVYGVEPNVSAHVALRRSIYEAGLDGVYEIVPTGIEHLAASGGVPRGSVDCIVSVLCLCGIPDPEANIKELYRYLKPGGRMYVYEHVTCTRHWSIKLYQAVVNLFWPLFLNGCNLQRDTGRYLRAAGPWTSIDLVQPVAEPWYQVVPHIVGVLTK